MAKLDVNSSQPKVLLKNDPEGNHANWVFSFLLTQNLKNQAQQIFIKIICLCLDFKILENIKDYAIIDCLYLKKM